MPLLNAARLFVVGSGAARDPGLVASTARAGDRRELLGGPLCYVAVLAAATLLCWRDGPAALLVVAAMCGGDGLADVVGRRWGRGNPLPWNPDKSWAGSLAMFAGGYVMAMGCATVLAACREGVLPTTAMGRCAGEQPDVSAAYASTHGLLASPTRPSRL